MIYKHLDFWEKYKNPQETVADYLNNKRYYRSPNPPHYWYPSVTTVTGFKGEASIEAWKKRTPDSEKIQKFSATRGTDFHNMIEKYLKNDPTYSKTQNFNAIESFHKIQKQLHKIQNIYLQEQCLLSEDLKMSGRVDCIAEYEGELSVIDFKTSNREKQEEEITHYYEQACCYATMFELTTKIPIKKIVIIMAIDQPPYSKVFKRNTISYMDSTLESIDNFWKHHDFDDIQNKLGKKHGCLVQA